MSKNLAYAFIFYLVSVFSNAFGSDLKEVKNLIFQSEIYNSSRGLRIPWNGSNTNSAVYMKLDSNLSEDLIINIVHPKNYSLFLNEILIYRNNDVDSFEITIRDLHSLSKLKVLEMAHHAQLLNEGNLKVKLCRQSTLNHVEILKKEPRGLINSNIKILFLSLFFVLALVRVLSKREFDFYFSGNFLRSPRLTLEKFLGDSINPLLLFLSILLLALLLNFYVNDFDYFDYEYRKFLGYELNHNLLKIIFLVILIILYLFLKRSLYLFYSWSRQETRNFSALWRTYILSFSNLSFWYFLLCSLPLLLLSNLDFGNYFQILFFIFAALNAAGGIMTYLNFNIKADLLTISGILAIDVFPIILLVHLLTF